MSSHLLQKSLKLFEETDEYKKKRAKRIKKEQVKKRKQLKGIQSVNEKVSDDEILKKIQQLEKLNANIPAAVSEKLFSRKTKSQEKIIIEPKKEESTVFTEEDFQRFEREYCFD